MNDEGFRRAFRDHQDGLVRLAFFITGDLDRAEDAVIDACVRVLPHWRDDHVHQLGGYLKRAVVNEAISSGRRESRARQMLESVHNAPPTQTLVDPADSGVLDRMTLWPALRELPARQRAAIVLLHVEGLSEEQTAQWLGVSTGTVKAHVSRGLDRLRIALQEATDHG